MFSEAKSAYGLFFFLTGAEVGEEAGGARRGIAGRWKRPETAKKTDFRWTQKPKKEREKAAVSFSGKTETETRHGTVFQNQLRFFSSTVAFLQQMQAPHTQVPETVSRDTGLYISDCLFLINNYKMITLILSGKPITRFTEEKIFLFIRFFSCFNYPVVKNSIPGELVSGTPKG